MVGGGGGGGRLNVCVCMYLLLLYAYIHIYLLTYIHVCAYSAYVQYIHTDMHVNSFSDRNPALTQLSAFPFVSSNLIHALHTYCMYYTQCVLRFVWVNLFLLLNRLLDS